jgi:hypothetical protein
MGRRAEGLGNFYAEDRCRPNVQSNRADKLWRGSAIFCPFFLSRPCHLHVKYSHLRADRGRGGALGVDERTAEGAGVAAHFGAGVSAAQ